MKLVIVGPVYPYRGGIAHYTTMLARAMALEHDVTVISFSRQYPRWLYPGASDRDPSLEAPQVEARYLIDSLLPWTWWRTAGSIVRLLPDVVVLQWWSTYWTPAFWTIARLLAGRGCRPVFLLHNVLPHDARPWDRWLTRAVLRLGRAFVVQSDQEQERLRALLPGAPVGVFPHPVSRLYARQRLDRQDARHRLGLPASGDVLLFFGIVRPYKGLRYLLQALALLSQKDYRPYLLVAGEFWEDRSKYEALVKQLGIGEQVRFDDRYIPNEELDVYFSATDTMVAPYVNVSASAAVQLALGFGLPVISTSTALTAMGPAGLMRQVPPGDAGALADAMLEQARQPLAPLVWPPPSAGLEWHDFPAVIKRLLEYAAGLEKSGAR